MFTRRPGRLLNGVVATAVVLATMFLAGVGTVARADDPTPQAGSLTEQEVARYKAANDTDPHVPLSQADKDQLAKKEQMVRDSRNSPGAASAAQYWGHTIGSQYQGQWNSYYCGPAAVAEAFVIKPGRFGVVDQGAAAWLMRTDTNGTAWSGVNAYVPAPYGTGYPVRDVLNYEIGTSWYLPQAVAYNATASDKATYISNLAFDIDNYWPIAGDAWEVYGSPNRLWGHPLYQTIFHWFTISGYQDYASTTNYMDSATTVWSAVHGWNTGFSSNTLVVIVGGRGYIW
jgi:hypothetical protein